MNPFAHLNASLSASRISTFLRCPLRYYFNYIERRPWSHVSGAMLLGQAVDVAIKDAVVAAQEGRDAAIAGDFLEEAYRNAVADARAPVRWPARYDDQKLLELGKRLVEALEPVLLAEDRVNRIVAHDVAFTVPLLDESGVPVIDTPLVGIFDFVEETDGGAVPLELKTASNRTQYLPDRLERDVQALIYALAAKAHGGEARVRYVSAVKLKSPEVIESENRAGEDQLRWIRGVVAGTQRAIRRGEFVATPSMMECGGCPFARACQDSGGVKVLPRRSIFGVA